MSLSLARAHWFSYAEINIRMQLFQQPGRLKLQSDNIIFRNIKTGKTEQFSGSDIKGAQWLIRARGYCLKITLVNGTIHRFDGMRESVSVYRLDLKYILYCLRHWEFYFNRRSSLLLSELCLIKLFPKETTCLSLVHIYHYQSHSFVSDNFDLSNAMC